MFEIPAILAGILTQIGLWSINLRFMGKSNTPLLKNATIFSEGHRCHRALHQRGCHHRGPGRRRVVIIVALYWFFGTEIGSACRATGNNEAMVRALGVNTKVTR